MVRIEDAGHDAAPQDVVEGVKQKPVSMLLDSPHDSTTRVAQSTAIKCMKPPRIEG